MTCVRFKFQIYQRIRDNQRISTDEIVSGMSVYCGDKQFKNVWRSTQKNILFWQKEGIYRQFEKKYIEIQEH